MKMLKYSLLLLLCFVSFVGIAKSNFENKFKWEQVQSIPPLPGMVKQHGLAAPFAGTIGSAGVVIVAGGCNFPNVSVKEGGEKRFYDDIYVLSRDRKKTKWITGFKLPVPIAYGASVSLPNGILCVGGTNHSGALSSVYLLKWDAKGQNVDIEEYPELPVAISSCGAAIIGNILYVVGGYSGGKLENIFISLDLSKKGTNKFKWEVLPEFPGKPRLEPVVVAQSHATEKHLYLFSGSSYLEEDQLPYVSTAGLAYNAATKQWRDIAEIKPKGSEKSYSLHGACGIPVGKSHVLFVGGVNRDLFYNAWLQERRGRIAEQSGDKDGIMEFNEWREDYFSHEPEWYGFNKEVLTYHTLTDTWVVGDIYPYPAPAGAKMVNWKDGWLVISGEIMPGVRSDRVYYGKIENVPSFGVLNWSVLVLYLLGMLYMGYYFMKRSSGTDDFFKGGGRIPWWAAGISIFATMLSAITFMAIPAKSFATDWKYFPMAITILIMAFPVVKYYLPFFIRLNITTAYEYLEKRFNYNVRFLASALFIIFMVVRMALTLFLPSLALTTVTNIDIYMCIVIMGVVTIIYCTMGGVEAVVWSDVVQGVILMGGALLAIVFLVLGTEGGLSTMIEVAITDKKFKMFDFSFVFTSATFWVIILGGLANNLISYSADQTVIQRYLTASDEKSAKKSILMNGVLSLVVSVVFYFIGTGLYTFYKTRPAELNFVMENTDSIFPHFIMADIPLGLAGLLIAAIFAATMSTVSSNVNSLSTAFTIDFYRHFIPKSSDKRQLSVARYSGMVLGGIGVGFALLLASMNILSILDFFNYILGLLSSGLAALFFIGIFLPRVGSKSAILGFVVGTGFLLYICTVTDVSFLLYGFIGMVSTILSSYIFSLFIPNRENHDGLTWETIKD